ncbi:hypothetical protein HMPREF1978_01864 [Actinomyces graevenitzii F0530]|uniref:Uncharacterized protein n=1 Tax=Actinomyces graevenitzii F0530 TaxID=1321817 RepID=U1R774_9ACTO|nr:hypothetical protein HMPREF1978_01864 [Actinomyces graevenitzii F0530]
MSGENHTLYLHKHRFTGSSPRERGKHTKQFSRAFKNRLIPA